jgi:hypothetical protein
LIEKIFIKSFQISSLEKRNWSCVALCESIKIEISNKTFFPLFFLVINSPDVYKKHTNEIWTIQDPNLICTRFIFLYVINI